MTNKNKLWIELELRSLGILKEGHHISSTNEAMVDCPDPNHSSKRCSINLRKGCYFCHSHEENSDVKGNKLGEGGILKYLTLIVKKEWTPESEKELESELLGKYPELFKKYLEKRGKSKYVKPKEHFNTVDYEKIQKMKAALQDDCDDSRLMRAMLIRNQGLTKSIMELMGLGLRLDGWGCLRVIIPIIEFDGNITKVITTKNYLFDPQGNIPKYIFHREEGQNFKTKGLYPIKCGEFQLKFKKLVIVEGEFKALCLISFLNPLGIGVISSISGARGKWYREEEILDCFQKDQEIYLVYDVDDTGIGVVEDIAFTISHRVKSVKICNLFKLLDTVSPNKYLYGKADINNPAHKDKITGGDPPNWILDEAEAAKLSLNGQDWPQEFIESIGKKFLDFIEGEELYDATEGKDGPILSHDSPHKSKDKFAKLKFAAVTRDGKPFIGYRNMAGADYYINKETNHWEFASGEKMVSWIQKFGESAFQRCPISRQTIVNLQDDESIRPFNPKTKDINEIYGALRRIYNFELPAGETLPYPVVGKPIKDFGRNSLMLANGILDISLLDEIDLVEHESGFLILDPSALYKLKIIDNYPELLNFTNLSVSLDPKNPPPFPDVFFNPYKEWLNFDDAALREGQKWGAHIIHPDLSIIDATLLCKGRGGAGKTRYIDIWIYMLGKRNCFITTATRFSEQFGLARLPGKSGIFIDNAKFGSVKNPELFQEREERIASRSGVPVELKRFDDIDYYTISPLVMGAEKPPPWADPGSQSARRLYILPFLNFWDFNDETAYGIPDTELGGKLIAVADAILLYFILPGIKMLREDGKFNRIESTKEDYIDMISATKKYGQFMEENLITAKRSEMPKDLESRIKFCSSRVSAVWALYQNHCLKYDNDMARNKNTAYRNKSVFSREFTTETGIKKERWPKNNGPKYFLGIKPAKKSEDVEL